MKFPRIHRRVWPLLVFLVPLAGLLAHMIWYSGPLAAVPVTVASVESHALHPAIFGIGTVEAQYQYDIGPTSGGRIKQLSVHVGDAVRAGQIVGKMDPVDLDALITAQQAAIQRAQAQTQQAEVRQAYAQTQVDRYVPLAAVGGASDEEVLLRQKDLAVAQAEVESARQNVIYLQDNLRALHARRIHLNLASPVDGLVVARNADPGSTIMAGQPIIQIIDPASLWINARFDQLQADGLAGGLPARIVLRSRRNLVLAGHVSRVEPRADAITEETLAKIVFDAIPTPLPPLGELAEVTIELPALSAAPVIPNAAIRIVGGRRGVWKIVKGGLVFSPVILGRESLDGIAQVRDGIESGDQVVVHSASVLSSHSWINVVRHIPGVTP